MLALALIAAQPAAEEMQVPVCALVTPGGDDVGFFIWSDGSSDEVYLSSTDGSAWPTRTVSARRPDSSNGIQFMIGGERGLMLELGRASPGSTRRSATLFRSDSERQTYPVAYGVCHEAAPPREPSAPRGDAETGIDIAAFDPARWPDADCALMLSDGRRVRFDPTLQQRTNELSLSSASLWSGQPATVRVRFSNVNGVQVGQFGEAGVPQGVRVLMVGGSRGVELYRFQDVGDPAARGVSGYGICGHRRMVRRSGMR